MHIEVWEALVCTKYYKQMSTMLPGVPLPVLAQILELIPDFLRNQVCVLFLY